MSGESLSEASPEEDDDEEELEEEEEEGEEEDDDDDDESETKEEIKSSRTSVSEEEQPTESFAAFDHFLVVQMKPSQGKGTHIFPVWSYLSIDVFDNAVLRIHIAGSNPSPLPPLKSVIKFCYPEEAKWLRSLMNT